MEVMARPSNEILIFCNNIMPYVKEVIVGNKPVVIFKDDAPNEIILEFESIKEKIGYES